MADLDPVPVLEAVVADPGLRVFVGDGRIQALPAKQSRRLLLLDKIAQAFEPGVRYPERDVSLFLGALHGDYAALRRYLVTVGQAGRILILAEDEAAVADGPGAGDDDRQR